MSFCHRAQWVVALLVACSPGEVAEVPEAQPMDGSTPKEPPTIVEWERAGAASETREDARAEPGLRERILGWYSRPTPTP